MKDVDVAGRFVFAGREHAECADNIVLYDVECAPSAVSLLLWSREERHLVF